MRSFESPVRPPVTRVHEVTAPPNALPALPKAASVLFLLGEYAVRDIKVTARQSFGFFLRIITAGSSTAYCSHP
ncbi:hypothetical protein LshimejAT787_1104830 [Lyophyllum shimeji]|uniref:Uncharacterized protein n=1 Tax=Lyophyllum shimeji TaxID=47721 RepID=A0A9P3PVR2_LYOSH|nr:hypothetical protein LshimejAT787_1104830 [Lyophyllum shimeji]